MTDPVTPESFGRKRITYTCRCCFIFALAFIILITAIIILLSGGTIAGIILGVFGTGLFAFSMFILFRNDRIEIYDKGIVFYKKKKATILGFDQIKELITIAIRIEGLIHSLDCYYFELLVNTNETYSEKNIVISKRYPPLIIRDYLSKNFGLPISQQDYDKADWKIKRREYTIA